MKTKGKGEILVSVSVSVSVLVFLLGGILCVSGVVLAGDPLEKDGDYDFLWGDPDGDMIYTIEEFEYGTDPYNSDSDNDALPDYWEFAYSPMCNPEQNALMDPTDPSDAHLDFDYLPKSNGSGYNIGEEDAKFTAVRTLSGMGGLTITWPGDSSKRFIDVLNHEGGMHYDNYEEYYRPYTYIDKESKQKFVRYMQTNPLYADSDGDGILDPDDFQPIGIVDGISLGGFDVPNGQTDETMDEKQDVEIDLDLIVDVDGNYDYPPQYDFDINLEREYNKESNSNSQIPSDTKHEQVLLDADNDGIGY